MGNQANRWRLGIRDDGTDGKAYVDGLQRCSKGSGHDILRIAWLGVRMWEDLIGEVYDSAGSPVSEKRCTA